MTVWSKPHPDVEEEFFAVLDAGIVWKLSEFCTYYFSGLHFHGGSMPYYKSGKRQDESIYYRLTLIAYPPTPLIDGTASMAFAALPGKTLLRLGKEMRSAT
jgi:hypothetical protein